VIVLTGRVVQGCKHFQLRLRQEKFRAAYLKATGEQLIKGTLNVRVSKCISINEHFRIRGQDIDEREDFLFEICRINGIWAYRIRPRDPCTGAGGHGDDTLEIACSQEIPDVPTGTEVKITLLRDEIEPFD
jgi:CTP-dependent riboflavin kinase